VRSEAGLTVQVSPEVLSQPVQPANIDVESGLAVKVTDPPMSNSAEHVGPQSTPAGLLLTVPDPSPSLRTLRLLWTLSNVAVRIFVHVALEGIVSQQVDPEGCWQASSHPVNVEPGSGVAVSMTTWSSGKAARHSSPQSIPGGALTTRPEPDPTVSSCRYGLTVVKVADTVRSAAPATITQPATVTRSQPRQPTNSELGSGLATSV
jgi:hypothetical protein